MVFCEGLYVGEDCLCGNYRVNKGVNRENMLRSGNGFFLWF